LLYNVFASRAEGYHRHGRDDDARWPFMNVRMLRADMDSARAARRRASAICILQRWTMEQAIKFASNGRHAVGRLGRQHGLVRQHLYLQQPTYGTSYVIGKIEIEQLLAERSRQLGDEFTLQRFMDELNAVGMIPMSLIHWELTGEAGEINQRSAAAR
jgi:uncharacterized protein (DUF885 family)